MNEKRSGSSQNHQVLDCRKSQHQSFHEGLPTDWVVDRYQRAGVLECQRMHLLVETNKQRADFWDKLREADKELDELRTQIIELNCYHPVTWPLARENDGSPRLPSFRRERHSLPGSRPPPRRHHKNPRADSGVARQAGSLSNNSGMHEHDSSDEDRSFRGSARHV